MISCPDKDRKLRANSIYKTNKHRHNYNTVILGDALRDVQIQGLWAGKTQVFDGAGETTRLWKGAKTDRPLKQLALTHTRQYFTL